jgi:hypothetical protein
MTSKEEGTIKLCGTDKSEEQCSGGFAKEAARGIP